MDAAPTPPHRRRARIREVARETLGYEGLRPGQAEAIDAVLQGRDTLAVLASGQGKSAIYQLAGTQLEGPTIVVSPLLSLQRDQVASIEDETLGGAAAVNSMVPAAGRAATLDALDDGRIEFVFLAPEQLEDDELLARLADAEPSLFVVD
jgi:ATP-dependent DNA helicase RecQ